MEKKVKIIILILVILVALGLATHLFLTPSSVKSGDSVLYMIAPDKLKAVNFQWTDDELKYVPGQ